MKLKTGKIEDNAVGAYKTIEEGVVKGYKAVEDAVVGTYQKIEDKFVKKFIKIMGIAVLMTGITTGAMAQEQTKDTEKPGFFKQAFRDMKESAKRQREIDKANFKAQKMETKAFYQEQKAKRNPEVRKMVQEQEYQKQMAEAKARQEAAQKRIDEAKNNQ